MSENDNHQFLIKRLSLAVRLASGISLIAGATVLPVAAQTSDLNQLEEEVLVTGYRRSIDSAQIIKREAEVFVDSVTAVDIGALPDRSVSEALQRIPGVQLQRTNENRDPARLAAEGGAVFVRGLSWVRTELNGRDIFSASNGRSLGFEDVSADLMAGVDVYKSPSANMIEGGIGGTVNLRTRLPFDNDDLIVAASYDYNYAELYEKGFGSFSGMFSNVWDTGVGDIGLLLSVSKAEIGNRTDSVQTGRYEAGEHDGATVYSPNSLGFRRIDWDQERNAYYGAMQWAPTDSLKFTLQTLRVEANPVDLETAVGINSEWGGGISPWTGTYEYDSNGFLTHGTLNNAGIAFNTRYGSRETLTSDVSFRFEYEMDQWSFSGDLQRVKSSANVLSMTAYTYLNHPDGDWVYDDEGNITGPNPSSGVDVVFDLRGRPSMSVGDPMRQLDASQYFWGAAMDHIEHNEAESKAARLDGEYTFEDVGLIKSLAFGARVSDRDAITRQSGWNWSLVSHQFWGGGDSALVSEHATDFAKLETFDEFYGGSISVPAVGWVPTRELVSSNIGYYYQLREAIEHTHATQGWGWRPLEPHTAYDLNPQSDNVSAGINNQNERTSAVYLMTRFSDEPGDLLGLPFDGNVGIRVVRTEVTTRARDNAGGIGGDCGWNPSEDCDRAIAFANAFNAERGEYTDYENSYTNVLPSLNLRFHLNEELQARFGLSRAMVRPGFAQTRPYTLFSFSFDGNAFDPNEPHTAIDGRHAYRLKPTTADQVDGSLEWYFAPAGSLTLSLFHKSLKDYVTTALSVDSVTYGGETFDFEVTRQVNAESGRVSGFEVGYSQFYDMLPSPWDGFGVQANFTYIDNSGGTNSAVNVFDPNQQAGAGNNELPIEGMSRTSYNLTLMYEKYDVSARLAYNWRERYLLTTSAANIERPVWFNDYGQLDGSLFYSFNDHIKAGIQVTNILAQETELEVGDAVLAGNYSWTQGDRRVAFVIRAQF